jgi:hypothetical protein
VACVLLCFSIGCGTLVPSRIAAQPQLRAHQDLYADPGRSTPTAQAVTGADAATTLGPAAAPSGTQSDALALRDRLVSLDGTLNVSLGVYSDCTGVGPIDANRADVDPCFLGRTYFVGHSPGVFSPLLHMGVGSFISWYDSMGAAHPMRIVSVRDFRRNSAPLGLAQPDVTAQFQTCLTADGSLDRILDAVPA